MIGYVTLGTNDLERAAAFYDELLGELGAKRMMEGDRFVAWSNHPERPGLGVIKPYDGQPATVGNGTMVALVVDSRDRVDRIHARALTLGGKDEGAPGIRGGEGSTFYAGYFRDLDGNKLNVFTMTAE
ncbi:MAG: VOC family protein [Rhodothalassiaceae bacterium]